MEQDVIARVAGLVRELRQQRGESQADLADALGEKRETVKFWEAGKRYFKAGDIISIANHFGVSADYLLGRSEAPTSDKDLQSVCDYTGLSPAAVDALREIPLWYDENNLPLVDRVISDYSAEIGQALSRIKKACEAAKPALDAAGDVSIQPPVRRLEDLNKAKQELELSLFSFSELSREIAERMFSAYAVLGSFRAAYDDFIISTGDGE